MAKLDPTTRSALGLATQAKAIGAPAPDPTTPLEASWRDFVFAEVWSRPGLDRRARQCDQETRAARWPRAN
jgi:4-carboxymuconolactone decarboxylase